jgi:uncharacterized protein (TIGR03083 family)
MTHEPVVRLDEDAVWAAIDEQRLSLADLLDDLSPAEWEHPSLCEGWRVRDVAAHLSLAQMGVGPAVREAVRAGGSFDRMIRKSAVRRAAAPRDELVAALRAMAGQRRRAPGVTSLEPLLDVLVHGQDIAVPLGRARTMPVEAAAAAATRVWTVRWPMSTVFSARRRFRGLRLVATDTAWSAGEGALVEGPVQALLLLLTGRDAQRDRLGGDGAARLVPASSRS